MLVWNVFMEDVTAGRITAYNIFNHGDFLRDCLEASKKAADDRNFFRDAVKHSLIYYFWSKCEYELILSGWPPSQRTEDRKVDVYTQVCLNFDVFIDYLWQNRAKLSG